MRSFFPDEGWWSLNICNFPSRQSGSHARFLQQLARCAKVWTPGELRACCRFCTLHSSYSYFLRCPCSLLNCTDRLCWQRQSGGLLWGKEIVAEGDWNLDDDPSSYLYSLFFNLNGADNKPWLYLLIIQTDTSNGPGNIAFDIFGRLAGRIITIKQQTWMWNIQHHLLVYKKRSV